MKTIFKFAVILSIAYSSDGLAVNEGKILRLDFSGSSSRWGESHSDVVQMSIEGGYEAIDCNGKYAAIRKSDNHLVSAALAAFMAGKRVTIQLSAADKYYTDRCIITDIFLNN